MLKALLAWAYTEYKNAPLIMGVKLVSGEWLERPVLSCDDGWVGLGPKGDDRNEPARIYINERHIVKAWVTPVKAEPEAKEDP